MSILEFTIFDKGGPVMWPLLMLALMGLTLATERTIFFHKSKIRAGEFLSGIKNLLSKRRLVEALTVCEETPSPVANIIKAALIHVEETEEKILSAIRSAALIEIPNLQRRVSTLAIIAKVAPLFGLLGTAIALYQGFSVLEAEGPYANSVLFSSYIVQGLFSTIAGLALAILAWLSHYFLNERVKTLTYDIEWAGHNIMEFILHDPAFRGKAVDQKNPKVS